MSNCNTCNTCSQPVKVCCCPTPAPTPVVPTIVVCKSPIELLFEQSLICFNNTACVNPLNYIIEQVSNFVPDPLLSDPTAIGQFLEGGTILSSCNLCCPKCEFNDGDGFIYALTDIIGFSNLVTTLFCKFNDTCCMSVNANATEYVDLQQTLANVMPSVIPICCNNFTTYVEELKNITDCPNSFLTSGIVEYGSLTPDGESQLHNIALMIQSIYPAATPAELCTYVTTMLTNGLVIYCDSNGMFIGSIESFLVYASRININCIR